MKRMSLIIKKIWFAFWTLLWQYFLHVPYLLVFVDETVIETVDVNGTRQLESVPESLDGGELYSSYMSWHL